MKQLPGLTVILTLCLPFAAAKEPPEVNPVAEALRNLPKEDVQAFMALEKKTKRVWAGERDGTMADFKPDSDPLTVEIVFLTADKLPAPQTSEDGQVIFLRSSDLDEKDDRVTHLLIQSTLKRVEAAKAHGT